MLNFDEEIKKFEKSIEPDSIDDVLASYDITDMNDITFEAMKSIIKNQQNPLNH